LPFQRLTRPAHLLRPISLIGEVPLINTSATLGVARKHLQDIFRQSDEINGDRDPERLFCQGGKPAEKSSLSTPMYSIRTDGNSAPPSFFLFGIKRIARTADCDDQIRLALDEQSLACIGERPFFHIAVTRGGERSLVPVDALPRLPEQFLANDSSVLAPLKSRPVKEQDQTHPLRLTERLAGQCSGVNTISLKTARNFMFQGPFRHFELRGRIELFRRRMALTLPALAPAVASARQDKNAGYLDQNT